MMQPFLPEVFKLVTNLWTKDVATVHPASGSVPIEQTPGKRMCRFCFDEEDVDDYYSSSEFKDEWLSPCLCSGSMKWVHRRCLEEWFKTVAKRNACQTCKFNFKRQWTMKPVQNWQRPNVALSTWDLIEMTLDGMSTYRMIKGFYEVMQTFDTYTVARQIVRVVIWRVVMLTDSRIAFYRNLCFQLFNGIADCRVLNCDKHVTESMKV